VVPLLQETPRVATAPKALQLSRRLPGTPRAVRTGAPFLTTVLLFGKSDSKPFALRH
jgi:hypothetical protein